jgi:hypothetical protein
MPEQKFFNSKDAAVLINTYGLALFPVQGFVNGCCTCGNKDCISSGKHPATPDGFKSATKDPETLGRLWAGRKGLNVGVATGAPSGVFVIDIDSAEGEAALAELGQVPTTLTVKTGNGRHLYFKYPNEKVITKKGILYKVDVRGDGGYVCGVGTNHYSGAVYQWVNPLEEIVEAPQFILDLVLDRMQPKHVPVPLNIKKGILHLGGTNDWTIDQVYELLSYIDPDCGYDEWINVGMGIHHKGLPFSVWDDWSRSGAKYNARAMHSHWKSFKAGGLITFGTVVKMAKDGGWKANREEKFNPRDVVSYNTETGLTEDQPEPVPEERPKEGKKKTLFYIPARDILPVVDANDFVQGFLGEQQLSVIYGESNCGKTFFATDLSFHVAQGLEWRGKRVQQGGVMYAALEGERGLRNRITAYRKHNLILSKEMPFAMMPCQLDFFSKNTNTDEFIELIQSAEADIGKVKMVVVDTLARALAGGDENSGQDMGNLVFHADKIRMATGAHVCFIHHSGKNKALGARGHSSLRAAVDTEIEISREDGANYSTIKTVKQREMEMAEDMFFTLKIVELGENKFNEKITSCVVEPMENPVPVTDKKTLNPAQQMLFDCLVRAVDDNGVEKSPEKDMTPVRCVTFFQFYEAVERSGFKDLLDKDGMVNAKTIKNATSAPRAALKKKGLINFNSNFIWLNQ